MQHNHFLADLVSGLDIFIRKRFQPAVWTISSGILGENSRRIVEETLPIYW